MRKVWRRLLEWERSQQRRGPRARTFLLAVGARLSPVTSFRTSRLCIRGDRCATLAVVPDTHLRPARDAPLHEGRPAVLRWAESERATTAFVITAPQIRTIASATRQSCATSVLSPSLSPGRNSAASRRRMNADVAEHSPGPAATGR